ncbi:MAG: hypothetical protein LBU67_05130 [Oscillospiraceae bacterium]|jgi:hypothetical protein|nr:hypothetical protein [Oscillospiraceae bacterium]
MKKHVSIQLRAGLCALLCACLLLALCATALAAPKAKATPVPVTPAQEAALAAALDAVDAGLAARAEDGLGHGLTAPLAAWVRSAAQVTFAKDGEAQLTLYLPKYATAYKGVPVYAGKEPLAYLRAWHAALAKSLPAAQAVKKGALVLPADTAPDAAAIDAWLSDGLLPGLDTWVNGALSKTKAASALSRLVLGVPGGAAKWQAKQFAVASQADKYDKKETDVASGLLAYLADSTGFSAPMTARWWPVYRQALRSIAWEMAKDGTGLTLRYSEPGDPTTLGETLQNALLDAYDNAKIAADDVGDAAVTYLQKDLAQAKKDGMEPREFSVNLAVFAAPTAEDIYQAFGAEGIAQRFAVFIKGVAQADAYFQDYAKVNPIPLPFPKTGKLMKPPSGGAQLAFKNGRTTGGLYVKIYALSGSSDTGKGNLVGSMFIQSGKKGTTSIKPGYYRMTYATGEKWYGEKDMFGPTGSYSRDEEVTYCQRNYILTITISPKKGDAGEASGLEGISPQDM